MFGSGLPALRPEAMADVPGVCGVPLTRAVVQYRDAQVTSGLPPTVADLGLALVLDGGSPTRSLALDLGSGIMRTLDLGGQLVVLDWVYEPTLEHALGLVAEAGGAADRADGATSLERYCGEVARTVLRRSGFGPIVRPTLLRMGFQDLARDLDPHESAAIRILLGPSRVARIRLDADHVRLVVATGSSSRDAELEGCLAEAFPLFEIRRVVPSAPEGTLAYLVLLPLPTSPSELRLLFDRVRRGVTRVIGRFEADRLRGMEVQLAAFGARDSLGQLALRDVRTGSEPLGRGAPATGPVH